MVGSTNFFEINLHDGDGNVLLETGESDTGKKLVFDIVNTSGKDITLNALDSAKPENKDRYHFCFSFRHGTLSPNAFNTIILKISLNSSESKDESFGNGDEWEFKRDEKTQSFYLSSKIEKVFPANKTITFVLEKIKITASPDGGARGTRVEIKYDNLKLGDNILTDNRLKNWKIPDQMWKKQVPLYVGFIGSSTILNDGSENTLTLSIQLLPLLETALGIKSLDNSSSDLPTIDISSNLESIDSKTLTVSQSNMLRLHLFPAISSFIEQLRQTPVLGQVLNKPAEELLETLNSSSADSSQKYEKLKAFLTSLPIRELLTAQLKLKQTFTNNLLDKLANNFIDKLINPSLKVVPKDELIPELIPLLSILKDLGLSPQDLSDTKLKELKIIDKVVDNIERSLNFQEVPLKALDEAIKFTISFDVATGKDQQPLNDHWALVSQNDADNIRIEIAQDSPNREKWIFWGLQKQGITPQWSFICPKGLNLRERSEILRLSISNIKTRLLAGYANLYIHYENIPGYWDGHITVPIHKGPLVYREYPNVGSPANVQNQAKVGCVGIGTDKPQAKLHISLNKDNENNPSLQIPALIVDGLTILNKKKQTASSISIKLNGSSFNTNLSDELKKPYVEVSGQKKLFETQQSQPRLLTQIIKTNGSLGDFLQHNTYGGEWNKWAKDVQQKANDGDMVSVVSFDAIGKPLDADQDAISLLTSINARKILNYPYVTTDNLTKRIPYALLFIKGKNESIEVLNYDSGGNAVIDTTYEKLLNLSTLTVNGTVNATKIVAEGACVSGMIMMWSGIVADIPSGWVLCDGKNGTPNLTERFIVAAGGEYQPHNSGNADKHQHNINISTWSEGGGSHDHSLKLGGTWRSSKAKSGGDKDMDVVNNQGNSEINTQGVGEHKHSVKIENKLSDEYAGKNRPKWYALCFIMKI
jgi:hypothetical protein